MRRKYRVTIIWDTWLNPGAEQEGLSLTRQIWSDMRAFDGYVSHQLLIDQNDPRHIIALGNWRRVVDADAALAEYKDRNRSPVSSPSSPSQGTLGDL